MIDSTSESSEGTRRFFSVFQLARLFALPFSLAAWIGERLLSRRALCLWFLVPLAVRTRGGWLRSPMSRDIHAFEIPLLPSGAVGDSASDLLRESGRLVWLSPGMVMAGAIVIAAIVGLVRPKRFHLATGLLFCSAAATLASVALNHPELISRLDQQFKQRQELSLVLQDTAHPTIELVLVERVVDWVGTSRDPGSWANGFVYLRFGGSVLMLTAAGLFLSMNGSLSRRLGHLGLWSLIALVCAAGVSSDRIRAEWLWQRAVEAEARSQFNAAEKQARTAIVQFPQLATLERTWLLLGKLDHLRSRNTYARAYFRAVQLTRNGERVRGVAEAEALARNGQPASHANRWVADLIAQQAITRFQQGNVQAAADDWRRAFALDATQMFRPLFSVATRTREERFDPDEIASVVDPLLAIMADRVMRGVLLAMLGDAYFSAGRFVDARDRYRGAVAAYSLPKHINYRAQRGMTGL